MDISCIISSGDLELYVLGLLSEEDNIKVAQLADIFPEVKEEINHIEQSLLGVGDDSDDAPSLSVKSDLFAKLSTLGTSDETTPVSDNNNEATIASMQEDAKVIPMLQPAKRSNLMMVAAVVGLIACAGIIAYLVGANNRYNDQMARLQSQITNLQQQVQTQSQNISLYQDTSYQKINLTHAPGKPDALAQIFWNPSTKKVYVANISLPAAPAGKQYQLWAIVDGKPVSAGMINTRQVPQPMIDFAKADAFAITLENAGGSPTPHLDQLYVIGKPS